MTQKEHEKLGRTANTPILSSSNSSSRRGVAAIIKTHAPCQKMNSRVEGGRKVCFSDGKNRKHRNNSHKYLLPAGWGHWIYEADIDFTVTQGKGTVIIWGESCIES